MANRLRRQPKLSYVPAVPAVPARAAYCTTETTVRPFAGNPLLGTAPVAPVATVSMDSLRIAAAGEAATRYGTGDSVGYSLTGGASGAGGQFSSYAPTSVSTTKCYPGRPGFPGSPSRTDQSDSFGWTGGARSIDPIPEFGIARAKLCPAPLGIQLGLCGSEYTHRYDEMSHSIVVRGTELTVVESGRTVFGPAPVASGSTVALRRMRGVVDYLVDDTAVYTSAELSTGEVYLGALMYAAGDYVENPSLQSLSATIDAAFELPSLAFAASDVAEAQSVYVQLAPLQFTAVLSPAGVARADLAFPPLATVIGSTVFNRVQAELPTLGFSATLAPAEVIPSNTVAILPALVLSAMAHQGSALTLGVEMRPAMAISTDAGYTSVNAVLPVRLMLTALEPYLPADESDGSDATLALDSGTLDTALLLVAMDSLDAGTSASITIVLELYGLDSLEYASNASLGQLVEMLAMEQVAVYSNTSAARAQALQYAVNVVNGALSVYEGFDFLQFATVDGVTYGVKADGLYEIGAATDDGLAIDALIDFGTSDFGDAHVKRMENAYLGVRTDGQVFLRVRADAGRERVYRVKDSGNMRKAKLADGVAGRSWSTTLELVSASFAEVDSIELAVGVTQRRGYGSRG